MAKDTELNYGIDASDLNRFVSEFERQSGLASEYSSNAGQYARTQIERLGLDGAAWQRIKSLKKKSPDRRMSILAQELDCALKLGIFDQLDAFHPLVPVLREILDHIESNDNRPKADPLIATLVGGD